MGRRKLIKKKIAGSDSIALIMVGLIFAVGAAIWGIFKLLGSLFSFGSKAVANHKASQTIEKLQADPLTSEALQLLAQVDQLLTYTEVKYWNEKASKLVTSLLNQDTDLNSQKLADQLQQYVDLTPASKTERKEILAELRREKNELQLNKRELNASMKEIRIEARQMSTVTHYTLTGLMGMTALQRQQIRYQRELDLAPLENKKYWLNAQINQLEKKIFWAQKFTEESVQQLDQPENLTQSNSQDILPQTWKPQYHVRNPNHVKVTYETDDKTRASDTDNDKDNWEGSFWEVQQPFPSKATLRIKYEDGVGKQTERVVDVRQFGTDVNGYILIGHCRMRNATRTFRTDRIKKCIDEETGEIVSDVLAYLREKIENKPVTFEDDDNLATFSISYGYEEEKSKNKTPGKWIKSGESITIKGQVFTKGNFYYGGKLNSLDGYGTEASLVDDSLKIENEPATFEDESLGYWSKFISLTPKGRGAFLTWLSGNRNDPDTPLGYVFIYFYGIERRITVDSVKQAVDDAEFKSLFDEILRLKGIYGGSRSFLNYAIRLLEIMCLLRPHVVSHLDLDTTPQRDSLLFKHRLATTVNDEKPIPAELALAWIRFYPDYNLKKPARRCGYEFSQMFTRLYSKKYGDGIVVKPNKTRLKIEYHPASSSLRGISLPQLDLPDPSNLTGPVNKLIAIADECSAELDAYSRYLAKPDTSRTDIEAILLLPDELSDLGATLGLDKFKKWADDAISTKNGLVDVEEFWTYTKSPFPSKINKKEAELIQNLAQKAGYGVAPDARYHHAKTSADGKLVLFPEGHGKYFEPSKAYSEMGMVLRLGAMVATIDSHFDQAELSLLTQLIDHDTNLSPTEKQSLHAYLVWRLNTPSNITGLKARLETLGKKEKAAVSRILIGVAMADGKIDPEEIKQLEKFYSLLGLDKALVTGDIHAMSSSKAGLRSLISPSETTLSAPTSFQLDESILAIHESETKDVQSMLGAIFVEDEPTSESDESNTDSTPIEEETGIDKQHYTLFERLIRKDKWTREEVEALCRASGLMVSGALETINDWSFDKVDAAVLEEDGDAIYVDQEIVEKIEG